MSRTDRFTVGGVMTTDLLTVNRDEPLDLAALVMDQRRIRQLLVIDDDGRLLGLVTYRALLRLLADHRAGELGRGIAVARYMEADPVTVSPHTPLRDAIRIMLDTGASALPVVDDGRAIGILSEHDVVRVAGGLLELFPRTGPGGP